MLRELLSFFRTDNPLRELASNFSEMMRITCDLTHRAGESVFAEPVTPEEKTQIYKQDVKVNKLQRSIRRRVIAHLSMPGNTADLPYCLLLVSLVKDVERIGDYAKNLSEVREIHPEALPEDEILAELREVREGVEAAFRSTLEVFGTSDHEQAVELIRQSKDLAHRSDLLIPRIARSSHGASATTAFVLTTRYYKRIGGHVLNVLSSVVMPLHKLDYYDEKELARSPDPGAS